MRPERASPRRDLAECCEGPEERTQEHRRGTDARRCGFRMSEGRDYLGFNSEISEGKRGGRNLNDIAYRDRSLNGEPDRCWSIKVALRHFGTPVVEWMLSLT